MIKLENYEVVGWEHAIRGMRNPMNSWDKSDSVHCDYHSCDECPVNGGKTRTMICPGVYIDSDFTIGPNDQELMAKLVKSGTDHRKFMRMITIYVDITAPLYWWKEFDTYKVGTVANSCSTMHKIHEKEFTLEDFSCEYLRWNYKQTLESIIIDLNIAREEYIEKNDKLYWWQMIQLLPSSYNQKRTIMFNYEVLANIYKSRKNHKLDEWREFCEWIKKLPYSEIITQEKD